MKLFQNIDPDFVRKNYKDQTLAEKIIQSDQRRASIMKIVVGSFLVVILVAIGYAINKQNIAKGFHIQLLSTVSKTDSCRHQAEQQMVLAAASRKQAEEMHMKIQQQLEECQKRK